MRKKLLVSPLAALVLAEPLLFPAPADAAAPAADAAGAPIIVTVTRLETPADEVAASVTILDKPAIDRAQDLAVADLLQRTPGVTVSRNGGLGAVTSLRIRGAEADQTVVVIDGVKVNDPASTGGGFNFADLLTGDIERLEVLRGPQSILWGSQAIGGVVNVVTAIPERPLEGSLDVEAGARETASGRAALGGVSGPIRWRLGGQTFTTDGISAIVPAFGGGERDGYRNRSLNGRLEFDLADGLAADLRSHYARGRAEFDGFFGDTPEYTRSETFLGYAGLRLDLLDGRFRNRLGYGYTETNRADRDPSLDTPRTFAAHGRNQRFEYQGSLAVTDGMTALVGLEHERSRFRTASPFSERSVGRARITSLYGQLQARPLDGLTLSGGVRHDDHDEYGGATLFAAGGVWALPTGSRVRLSYGEGFKAPTLYQLFSEYGNLGLGPERADGWEAGVEQRLLDGRLSIGAAYFERTTRDQIDFASCPFPPDGTDPLCLAPGTGSPRFGYYSNIGRAEAHGIEAQAALRLAEGLVVDGNYTWVVAENRSPASPDPDRWLPRRPRHAGNVSISYEWPSGLSTGAAVRWAGRSFDDTANLRALDGYALVDLRAELALSSTVRLFARAENLFDESYATADRYGTLGRSVHAGVRGRF